MVLNEALGAQPARKCSSVRCTVIKHPPTLGGGEHTKSYKTFGGKLVSSKVEDKENGEFPHEVIITVQFHSAPARRCLHGKDTLARHGGLRKYQQVSKQWHAHTIQNTLDSKWRL
ncbi:hypothetical protein ATANTOWER_025633 [Ataeniobius toweri]|uniref:Uncharacterized protein n=1 Tax=Ataeniobius toweri TaxID=208326 RepID=A0ABU7B241_9TELE|nr:hypothetical protein [Ataeniobius toweri]